MEKRTTIKAKHIHMYTNYFVKKEEKNSLIVLKKKKMKMCIYF